MRANSDARHFSISWYTPSTSTRLIITVEWIEGFLNVCFGRAGNAVAYYLEEFSLVSTPAMMTTGAGVRNSFDIA